MGSSPAQRLDRRRARSSVPGPQVSEPWSSSGAELGLRGSLVEGLYLPADRVGVCSKGGFVEVRLGPRLRIEMAVAVGAAHQHGRIAQLGLAHVSRDIR